MAESSKKKQNQQATQAKQSTRQGPRAQRALSKKHREEQQQRLVIIAASIGVGLMLLVLLGGVIYDQLWVPAQAVARVSDETLTRSDYWQEQRYQLVDQIAQNFEMLALFGDQEFATQFADRSPVLNEQVETLRAQPINEQFISQWHNNELLRQGAASIPIVVSDAEINQEIAQALGTPFAPITPTATVTPTAMVTPTAVVTPTRAPTVTPGGPTPTLPATITPLPTATPEPTLVPAAAADQVSAIVDEIYQQFTTELELFDAEPNLTQEDFREALRRRYAQQIMQRRVEEYLVPEDTFVPSEEPQRIQARQILLAVEVPEDATEEESDETYTERQAEAEELVEELRDGAVFAAIAEEESDDLGSRDMGGDIGYFDAEGTLADGSLLDPDLVEPVFALEEGEISDPIRTQFGWHIIEVTDREIPDEEQQLRAARTEAFEEWMEEQREQAEVRRFPEPTATATLEVPDELVPTPEPTYLPGPPTPTPMTE